MATAPHPPSGETAAKIRVAAQEAIKHLPGVVLGDSEINEIIRQTGSDQLNMAERLTRAASLATDIAKSYSSKPVNYLSATPEAIDRERAAMGLLPLARGGHDAMRMRDRDGAESGGSARSGERRSSADYTRELAGGSTYNALAKQGYDPAQINSAINYTRDLGANDNFAKKAIKLDQERRGKLKEFVEAIDPSLTQDQVRAKAKEFIKSDPKLGKAGITADDIVDTIRRRNQRKAELQGDKSVHSETRQETTAAIRALGGERRVEADHRATVAALDGKNDATDDISARLSRRAAQRNQEGAQPATPSSSGKESATSPAQPQQGTVGDNTKSASTEKQKPAEQRQAVNRKALNPTV